MNHVRTIRNSGTRNGFFDLNHFFDQHWRESHRPPFYSAVKKSENFSPRVDVREGDAIYEVSAELPGVSKEDIKVTIREGALTLEAESKQSYSEENDGQLIRQERRYGKYVRQFQLGEEVQESDVSASFKDGILKLTIPKVEPKKPETREIEILSH